MAVGGGGDKPVQEKCNIKNHSDRFSKAFVTGINL
jgi:hypothetical protein